VEVLVGLWVPIPSSVRHAKAPPPTGGGGFADADS